MLDPFVVKNPADDDKTQSLILRRAICTNVLPMPTVIFASTDTSTNFLSLQKGNFVHVILVWKQARRAVGSMRTLQS